MLEKQCGKTRSLRGNWLRDVRIHTQTLTAIALLFAAAIAVGQSQPVEVTFSSDGRQLHGFLWKPLGNGPFRAVLWNHGSEKLPGSEPALAAFYTAHSYVFFVPHRRGQGRSPGNYIQDEIAQAAPGERAGHTVELLQAQVDDVVAGLNFLKSQPSLMRRGSRFQGARMAASKLCSPGSATSASGHWCHSLRVRCHGSGIQRCKTG